MSELAQLKRLLRDFTDIKEVMSALAQKIMLYLPHFQRVLIPSSVPPLHLHDLTSGQQSIKRSVSRLAKSISPS